MLTKLLFSFINLKTNFKQKKVKNIKILYFGHIEHFVFNKKNYFLLFKIKPKI